MFICDMKQICVQQIVRIYFWTCILFCVLDQLVITEVTVSPLPTISEFLEKNTVPTD